MTCETTAKSLDRPYVFYELTNSLCIECLRVLEAKIIFQDECVYLHKTCSEHGFQKVLISTDIAYYRQCRDFLKPGQMPLRFNTQTELGCPYDCGLCPDHEQHSCLTLIEITDRCNLTCPICYAESSPEKGQHRSLDEIRFMLDELIANEGEPDVVQLSGGEPTLHPDFFEILAMAKASPIRHLMVNTNGIRIATEEGFAEKLAEFMPGFELYLQFDSLKSNPLKTLRGADLRTIREQALARLNALNMSTTLVVTLKQGVNDDEIGDIIDYALKQPCVRGVTFQPIQQAGRTEDFDPALHRLTLAEVRQKILAQSPYFAPEDVIPVPCHPDCIAMAYGLRQGETFVPLSQLMDPQAFFSAAQNTVSYERNSALRDKIYQMFALNHSPESASHATANLLCCLPGIDVPSDLGYQNVFRVFIMEFMDAYNFDTRSVKRSCVHIMHPDGRVIPFDTYNLFYRDNKVDVSLLSSRHQKGDRLG
jgi:7,8-dihydro-6-hydroxymethylpterin dimethyltransferase